MIGRKKLDMPSSSLQAYSGYEKKWIAWAPDHRYMTVENWSKVKHDI